MHFPSWIQNAIQTSGSKTDFTAIHHDYIIYIVCREFGDVMWFWENCLERLGGNSKPEFSSTVQDILTIF